MGLKIITAPMEESITLAEVRAHCEVVAIDVDSDGNESHPDDALLLTLLSSAREHAENFTGLSLAEKVYELALDKFPADEIELFNPPTISITSVKYIDSAGVETTISSSDYVLDDYQKPAWLLSAIGAPWPAPMSVVNAVKIRYLSGYGTTSDSEPLPYAAKAAILLLVGHWYANREAVNIGNITSELPFGVEALLRPLRVRLGFA